MDPSTIVTSMLLNSMASIAPTLRDLLKARRGTRDISIQMGEDVLELSSLTPDKQTELIQALLKRIEASEASGTEAITDKLASLPAKKYDKGSPLSSLGREPPKVPSSVAGATLTFAPEVFADARRRIAVMFKINVALSAVLAVILLAAIIACVVFAFAGHSAWSLAFGGVSAADILGVYVLKPLSAISDTVVASQRLEVVHLRLQEQMRSCGDVDDVDRRIECQTQVWEAIQKELAALGSGSQR